MSLSLTFYLNRLSEVVDVDHEPPLVVQVERCPREDHFLPSSTKLLVLHTEEPCPDGDAVGALVVEDLLEDCSTNSRRFGQKVSGKLLRIVDGSSFLTVTLAGIPTS